MASKAAFIRALRRLPDSDFFNFRRRSVSLASAASKDKISFL
jgi:hypothetical protein